MDTEPDFSIITPSYNYARYVRECIESVKNQEGVTFEHIIQDAGSTDGTLDILHSYPHLKLHVEKDSGMSEGINRGFRKARGKWVMWLNTDDRLLPGALAAVKAFADSRPDADIVYGAWNFIGPDGEIQRAMKALPYSLNMHIWYGTYLASTALFLRRSTTIEEGFLLDERFHYDMDGEYYARLGRAGKKFVHYNRLLADFRWHGDNLSAPNIECRDMDAARSCVPGATRPASLPPFLIIATLEEYDADKTTPGLIAYPFADCPGPDGLHRDPCPADHPSGYGPRHKLAARPGWTHCRGRHRQ